MEAISKLTTNSRQTDEIEAEKQIDFSQQRVVVVIPSYNEERFIGSVVHKILRYPVTVVVVDDGSSDDTSLVARMAGATVIRQPINQGKGAALNIGFKKARELKPDVIVMIDADGQHLPEQLSNVVRPILEDEADIVVGSRYIQKTSQVPLARVIGHWAFNLITQAASGVKATDSQSGYRAFSPKAFAHLNFGSSGFSVESEMQFLAHQYGLRLAEVPITIRYTDKPKRSVFTQGMIVLNGVLRFTGQFRPLLFFGAPGILILFAGMGWGMVVVERYSHYGQLAVGYAMISLLLSIIGVVLFSTGITLHSIRGLLMDLLNKDE